MVWRRMDGGFNESVCHAKLMSWGDFFRKEPCKVGQCSCEWVCIQCCTVSTHSCGNIDIGSNVRLKRKVLVTVF